MSYLLNKLQKYRNKGYVFGFDTNILIDYPSVLEKLKKEKIWISRKVYQELDSKKSSSSSDSDEVREIAAKRREALRVLEKCIGKNVSFVQTVDKSYVKSIGLEYSLSDNDDFIIASYIKKRDETNNKFLFITSDRGARAIAKDAGLEVLEFDISKFKEDIEGKGNVTSSGGSSFDKKLDSFLKTKTLDKVIEEKRDVVKMNAFKETELHKKKEHENELRRERDREILRKKNKQETIGLILLVVVVVSVIFGISYF